MPDNFIYAGAALLVLIIIIICAAAFRKNDSGGDIDEMSGTDFEDFMAEILHRSGIEVLELTKGSGDFGADIIVMLKGERTAVQCKRYSRPIGVKAVQEAISSMSYYKCTKAAVITNSTFTRQARELAAESGVILWDREDVFRFMECADGRAVPPEEKTTLRFHRLTSGELSDESVFVSINGTEYELLPQKMTVITVPSGEVTAVLRNGFRKAAISLALSGKTRDFTAGIYKNRPFLEEIR